MELTRSTLHIDIDGRSLTVAGEAYLPGYGSPDFVVYKNEIDCWDDGEKISADTKAMILKRILEEAGRQGLRIEIE